MRNQRNHLGTSFETWNSRQMWFWSVVEARPNGGMIGAAATEREAEREARRTIEEMSSRHRATIAWEVSLTKLEHYLTHGCCASA